MLEANHTLEDEFQTPDRVQDHVVDTIAIQGLELAEDLQAQGKGSEVLEDLLLDLHASSRDHRSFESCSRQNLSLALDAIRSDLKPTLWA